MTATREDTIARGEKVVLRGRRSEDARNDYAWRRDPELARYDATHPITVSYEEFRRTYRSELAHADPRRRVYAIEDRRGRHIGSVMYYNIDLRRREAELGITIGEPADRGHGYGAEAVSLLIDHIFTASAITRVYLHTLDWNVRAQRAFRRAGFRPCGRVRRGEHRFYVMELLREWRWEREYQRRALPPSGGR